MLAARPPLYPDALISPGTVRSTVAGLPARPAVEPVIAGGAEQVVWAAAAHE